MLLQQYQGSGEAELASHKTRLASRLQLYAFRERQVPSTFGHILLAIPHLFFFSSFPLSVDFNCQFSAVADQVNRSPVGAATLRQQVVLWLRQNAALVLNSAEIMCHTLTTDTLETYVTRLAEGMWGDHLSLQVMAELLQSRIWVISSVSAAQFVICINPLSPPAPERHFALCHLHSTFYSSLELLPA